MQVLQILFSYLFLTLLGCAVRGIVTPRGISDGDVKFPLAQRMLFDFLAVCRPRAISTNISTM